MSECTLTQCDQCGKRTDDHYNELGWVHMEATSSIDITLSLGRDKKDQAKTKFKTGRKDLDFCRFECMKNYIWQKKGSAQGKSEKP